MSPVAIRLSIMMFLQFFVWGAWYVTAPNFLSTIGFEPGDIANTYSVGPIAGIITPLFVGMIADRLFSAQHVLGILHIAGGGLMFLAMQNMDGATSPDMLNWIFFGYMLTYYPTLALTNTVAMKNMTNPDKEFPYIRVFGTIGWIAAGVLLSAIEADNTIVMFQITAIAAVVLGAFSLSLPNTPPNKETGVSIGQLLGVDALVLLKNKSYAIFMLASVLICIPLAFYYQIASRVVEKADIAMGVDREDKTKQGAGDQGLMFGYATNETKELMPATIQISHDLVRQHSKVRNEGGISWLRPDAKSQVTIQFENGQPDFIDTVVLSTQHDDNIEMEVIHKEG